MNDDLSFILGLANEHEEAVGFIPSAGIAEYVADGDYIIQRDRRGRRVGYLLHGKPTSGGILTVAQAVIDYDFRQRGHGLSVMAELIQRAAAVNARTVKLTCADDLHEAHLLWRAAGFERVNTLPATNRRNRTKGVYLYELWPMLFRGCE